MGLTEWRPPADRGGPAVLIECKGLADYRLGDFLTGLLVTRDQWVRRRVETVRMLDDQTLERRITLDLSLSAIRGKQPEEEDPFATSPLYMPLPVLMLTKDLLLDFSARDQDGKALVIADREEDSYAATSVLMYQLGKVPLLVPPVEISACSSLLAHLDDIVYQLPEPPDYPRAKQLKTWSRGDKRFWPEDDSRLWEVARQDEHFTRWLRDFTFNFLVIVALPLDPTPRIIKLSYQEQAPDYRVSRAPFRHVRFPVNPAGIGTARSYHLVVKAPDGLAITGGELVRIEGTSGETDGHEEVTSYRRRLLPTVAHVYTSTPPVKPGSFRFVVCLTVRPPGGLLPSAALTALFGAAVISAEAWKFPQLRTSSANPGVATTAMVALLLTLVPALLAIHLAQPSEHLLLRAILRPVRWLLLGILPLVYAAAGAALFDLDRVFVIVVAALSWVLFFALFIPFLVTRAQLRFQLRPRVGRGVTQLLDIACKKEPRSKRR